MAFVALPPEITARVRIDVVESITKTKRQHTRARPTRRPPSPQKSNDASSTTTSSSSRMTTTVRTGGGDNAMGTGEIGTFLFVFPFIIKHRG